MGYILPANLWRSYRWRNDIFCFEFRRKCTNFYKNLQDRMLIKEKIGNLNFFALYNRKIDYLLLEWYETNKRILHKKTAAGLDIVMKFFSENQQLTEGDIIYEDDFNVVAIDIL